jgi:hypothetical protein
VPGPKRHTGVLGGLEQGVQEPSGVGGIVGQVAFDLGDGVAEDGQAIPEFVEFVTGHDELVLAETELVGAAARLVVALAAGALAILPRPSGARGSREPAATPPAPECPLDQ